MELKRCGCYSDTLKPICMAFNSSTKFCDINYCNDCEYCLYTEKEIRENKREYVIVCNEHDAIFNGALLFWGHKTNDNENRSFSGYTSDFNNCEIYSLADIKTKDYNYPIYNSILSYEDFISYDDIIIKIEDLEAIQELKMTTILYKP